MHLERIARALKGNARRSVRIALGIKPRPKHPVLAQNTDAIVERHSWLCGQLQELIPADFPIAGTTVCEVGPGDCLATAALALGVGAARVELVEVQPSLANEKQREALERLRQKGVRVDTGILKPGSPVELDSAKIAYHKMYMDDFVGDGSYSLVFSFCVLEHVEDLATFFASCLRATRPGGLNIHMIDLGGHSEFEDPVPPLEFQTIPDWLFDLMYPRFNRATRRFVSDYVRAMEQAGFVIERVAPLRKVDAAYLEEVRPRLRTAAKAVAAMKSGSILGIALATVFAQSVLVLILGWKVCQYLEIGFGAWAVKSWLLPVLVVGAACWGRAYLPPVGLIQHAMAIGVDLLLVTLLGAAIGFKMELLTHEFRTLRGIFTRR